MYKVIGGVAALAAAAIAVILLSQGTQSIDASAGRRSDELLGWDEIVADARHS